MVHCSASISYPTTTNAIEYHDTEQGSGDRNEVGGFAYWRKCNWYEPDLGTTGKLDTSVTRYQEEE